MTKKIKFSHRYWKMPLSLRSGDYVYLLDVLDVKLNNLSKWFIDYDTRYGLNEYYCLTSNDLLLLFLQTKSGELFTTLRRTTKEKGKYYRSLIGKELEIEIDE